MARTPRPRASIARAATGGGRTSTALVVTRNPRKPLGLLNRLGGRAGLGILIGLVILILVTIAWMGDLSKLKDLEADFKNRVTLTYLYADGSQLRVEGSRPGPLIEVGTLPDHVVNAVLAAEDHKFFEHSGFRIESIFQAAVDNAAGSGRTRGASTITQQLVKITYGRSEKTLFRKVQEVIIASQAESHFRVTYGSKRAGKERILSLYMSRVELGFDDGQPVYGFQDAATRYFGKDAKDLTLGEAAMLAGMLLSWDQFNPVERYAVAKKRRDLVLDQMVRFGFIDQARGDQAKAIDNFPIARRDRSYRYALDELRPVIQSFSDGIHPPSPLKINMTLDPKAQRAAAGAVARVLGNRPNLNAAVVALSGDGAIKVMIGGRDYGTSQFNAARRGNLSVGSTLKPFIYATALAKGIAPRSFCTDAALPIASGWSPANHYSPDHDRLDLASALAISSNHVAVRLANEVGREPVMQTLRAFGYPLSNISKGITWPLSSAGSPLDLATAYLPFANGGNRAAPYLLSSITDEHGKELRGSGAKVTPAGIDASVLDQMRSMLRYVVTNGTGRGADGAIAVAGKTGTTDDNRAGWFIGFGDGFVIAVWVGVNGSGAGSPDVAGSHFPARIFAEFMREQRSDWIRGLSGLSPLPDFDSEAGFVSTGTAPAGLGCQASESVIESEE